MYESNREGDRSSTPASISWITRHPVLFWGGLWTIALSVTVGVTVGLLHGWLFSSSESFEISSSWERDALEGEREWEVGQKSPESSEVRPFQDNAPPTSTPKTFLPLWSLAAIAVGCSVGSFFVTLVLKSLTFSQSPIKKLGSSRTSQELSLASKPRFQAQFGATPYHSPIIAETQPVVTVLPPEVTTPLDAPDLDGNLLEQLDLRKRHSLSSLMEYTEEESYQ